MEQPGPERDPRMRWWHPLALAVMLGTIAGFVQVAAVLYRRHVLHAFTWTSRDITWMSPLGNVAILLAPALLVVLVRVVRPGWARWGPAAGFVAWGAALSAVLNVPRLHPLAAVVLAAGVAVQLGRAAGRRPHAWSRWVPRLAVAGVAGTVVALAAAGTPGSARHPGAAAPGAPNVIVLILDTVRAASTSLHGYARPTTPALERLAREGVRFDWAISPSSWTLPSHASMFTGRPSSTLSASWRRPLDGAHPTVAELLAGRGYATAAFVGNLFYTHHESGVGRGFQTLYDFRRSRLQVLWSTTLGQTPFVDRLLWGERSPSALFEALRRLELRPRAEPQNDRRRGVEVVADFLRWQRGTTGPFLAFINLYDAHDPYDPIPGYDTLFSPRPGKQDHYDAAIRYMDDQLGHLLEALQARGVLERTFLVVTSDHGEQWGEHGLVNHGNSLYLPAIHVPLVMRLPGRARAGERIARAASLTDLAATVLDAAGVADAQIPGASLLGPDASLVVAETEALDPSARVRSPAERGSLASIVRDSFQFIRNGDSTYQLFNVVRDYAQESDLVADRLHCGAAVVLDSLLRTVSRVPATPAFTAARCDTVSARGAARPGGGR